MPGDAAKRSWDPETAIHETVYYCDKSDLNQAMFYSMSYISEIDDLQNNYVTTCLFLYYWLIQNFGTGFAWFHIAISTQAGGQRQDDVSR